MIDLLIVTPDAPTAAALQRLYDPRKIAVRPIGALMGIRADRIVVLPKPEIRSTAENERFELAFREGVRCRISDPDGEIIRL